ncbi:hypothetical protein DM01DRAFT_1332774 [Hesseltinella vesiculosa]|uniref:Uncharacterized protein n=1 Tax=Hesseltinella vesiculosa TaxID=101127 RepID=A0A1X2GT56_9FUNG|nr:hypothetical protein DM01DRAFT_1332774 [Hesseltinella vesiculosa]
MAHALDLLGLIDTPVEDVDATMTHGYYGLMAVTGFICLVAIGCLLAVTRLLLFHLRLASLNMTTVEYISHPLYQPRTTHNAYGEDSSDDSMDNDDEEQELDDMQVGRPDNDIEKQTPWADSRRRRQPRTHFAFHWVLQFAWARTVRSSVRRSYGRLRFSYRLLAHPSARYPTFTSRCLYLYDHGCSGPAYDDLMTATAATSNHSHHAPPRIRTNLAHSSMDKIKKQDNQLLEEFLATRTIRPARALSEGELGPDYDDDMGLDTEILDLDYDPITASLASDSSSTAVASSSSVNTPTVQRSSAASTSPSAPPLIPSFSSSLVTGGFHSKPISKAARLLDMSEGDVQELVQSSSPRTRSPDEISID